MTTPTKVDKKDLDQAIDIQRRSAALTMKCGKIEFAKQAIEKQRTEVLDQFEKLIAEEEKFLVALYEKYGVGTLNTETGEFTPATGE